MERLTQFIKSILAGIAISIGGFVNLSCDNRYIGAFAFAVGLITVVMLGFNLYTGRIGYVITDKKVFFVDTLLSIPGNLLGCLAVGLLLPVRGNVAAMCVTKLDKNLSAAFVDAIFCGILIYICVDIWKKYKTIAAILFCVPVFILCGFEHSVADMFYFFNARMFSAEVWVFLAVIVAGNGIGSLIFHGARTFCTKIEEKKDA